jgi:DNA-binding transcriptional ArsR family regulator
MDRTEHLLTPASLKALAHPIRVRLLGLLRADGPATATSLAARLEESSGTTSYHLRQLAGAGFVVEDAERGNARERWWRAAQDGTRLDVRQMDDDPATQAAMAAFMTEVARAAVRQIEQWVQDDSSFPKRWRDVSTLSDFRLSLSAAELDRLNTEVEEVVQRYRRDPRKGDYAVAFQYQSFPLKAQA